MRENFEENNPEDEIRDYNPENGIRGSFDDSFITNEQMERCFDLPSENVVLKNCINYFECTDPVGDFKKFVSISQTLSRNFFSKSKQCLIVFSENCRCLDELFREMRALKIVFELKILKRVYRAHMKVHNQLSKQKSKWLIGSEVEKECFLINFCFLSKVRKELMKMGTACKVLDEKPNLYNKKKILPLNGPIFSRSTFSKEFADIYRINIAKLQKDLHYINLAIVSASSIRESLNLQESEPFNILFEKMLIEQSEFAEEVKQRVVPSNKISIAEMLKNLQLGQMLILNALHDFREGRKADLIRAYRYLN